MTPYEQGAASFKRGEAGPPIPKGDATWSERLFNRGWCDARSASSPDAARAEFRKAAQGYGRAGTADLPGGPDMSMDDAAEVYARLSRSAFDESRDADFQALFDDAFTIADATAKEYAAKAEMYRTSANVDERERSASLSIAGKVAADIAERIAGLIASAKEHGPLDCENIPRLRRAAAFSHWKNTTPPTQGGTAYAFEAGCQFAMQELAALATSSPDAAGSGEAREAIARLIALAGLGTISGERREPHGGWNPEEFAERILAIIPERVEKRCLALADAILALRPDATQTREAEGTDKFLSWRGGVEGYDQSLEVATKEIGDEAKARSVLWLIGLDHVWKHVEALRAALNGRAGA